jgi:signal transduction histidine kinase
MSRTIDDLMSFTRVEGEKRPFRVNEIIAKAVYLVDDLFQSQKVRVEFAAGEVPDVCGFANEFAQVLLNILVNARDFLLERKTSDARIVVQSGTSGGRAVVTITDNAGGIAEEVIDKIFDAFFTTKALGKGTGVGLFISKTIIEQNMGGRLTVRNAGGGAEFRIEM